MGKTIIRKVKDAARELNGQYYISRKGVPLVILHNLHGDNWSLCYFGQSRTWHAFSGWNKFDSNQQKIRFSSWTQVRNWYEGRPYLTISTKQCPGEDCIRYIRENEDMCKYCRRKLKNVSYIS